MVEYTRQQIRQGRYRLARAENVTKKARTRSARHLHNILQRIQRRTVMEVTPVARFRNSASEMSSEFIAGPLLFHEASLVVDPAVELGRERRGDML